MNSLQRHSAFYCERSELFAQMNRLNKNGWVVTHIRDTNRTKEVALEAIYVGSGAKERQEKQGDYIAP